MTFVDYDAGYCFGVGGFGFSFSGPLGEVHACGVFAFDGEFVASDAYAGDVSFVLGAGAWGAVDAVVVELSCEVVGDESFEPRPCGFGATPCTGQGRSRLLVGLP